MKLYGLEKFSLVDYDGCVACTLFLGGCNFKCPFCHNAPLVTGLDGAIDISLREIDEYLDSRSGVIDAVVISGGEPTLHEDLYDLVSHFKSMGLKVKLDSNGTNPNVIKKLLEDNLLDYIAMDIKNGFSSYDVTCNTEVDHKKIKESIELIMNSGIDYEFRTTLVEELHEEEDIKEMGEMLKGAKKYFLQKFVDHGSCIMQNLHEVEEAKAKKYLEIMKEYIPSAKLRGY